MKTLASVAFGAAALTAASVGLAEPASARSNVGVYISPYGIGVTLNPNYCSDYWYRRNHWDYCARYDGDYDNGYYDNDYWPFFGGYYSGYRVRHYDHDRHHDNHWGGNDHRGGDHRHH